MGDVFRGWRRKTGLVALVIALLLTVIWIRSLHFVDSINLSIGPFGRVSVFSVNGLFACSFGFEHSAFVHWKTVPLSEILIDGSLYLHDGSSFGDRHNFGFDGSPITVLIPFSFVVVPITVAALWLMLAKPTSLTQTNISAPQDVGS